MREQLRKRSPQKREAIKPPKPKKTVGGQGCFPTTLERPSPFVPYLYIWQSVPLHCPWATNGSTAETALVLLDCARGLVLVDARWYQVFYYAGNVFTVRASIVWLWMAIPAIIYNHGLDVGVQAIMIVAYHTVHTYLQTVAVALSLLTTIGSAYWTATANHAAMSEHEQKARTRVWGFDPSFERLTGGFGYALGKLFSLRTIVTMLMPPLALITIPYAYLPGRVSGGAATSKEDKFEALADRLEKATRVDPRIAGLEAVCARMEAKLTRLEDAGTTHAFHDAQADIAALRDKVDALAASASSIRGALKTVVSLLGTDEFTALLNGPRSEAPSSAPAAPEGQKKAKIPPPAPRRPAPVQRPGSRPTSPTAKRVEEIVEDLRTHAGGL